MIRAIQPAAVYRPAASARAKSKAEAAKAGMSTAAAGLPAGVERFDRCGEGQCDTRDPMIVRTSYPMAVGTPTESAERPPAIVENRSQPADDSFLGLRLPALPSASEVVDRTVAGTAAAYDGLKQSVTGAIDALR